MTDQSNVFKGVIIYIGRKRRQLKVTECIYEVTGETVLGIAKRGP